MANKIVIVRARGPAGPGYEEAEAQANAAAASASAAAGSQLSASNDAAATAADRVATGQDRAAASDSSGSAAASASSASANAAATAADRVQTGLDAEQTAADRAAAETAADVAQTAGTVFDDDADGIAATSDGDYFWVVSSDDDEVLQLWQNVSSVATDTGKRTPSASSVNAIAETYSTAGTTDEDLEALVDNFGQIARRTLGDGTTELAALTVAGVEIAPSSGGLSIAGTILIEIDNDEWDWARVDANYAIWEGGKDGEYFSVNSDAMPETLVTAPRRVVYADLLAAPSYGQSLAIGSQGQPAITLTQRFDSVMFVGGVRAQQGAGDSATRHGALVPLVESDNDVYGETIVSGAVECLIERVIAEDGRTSANKGFAMLGSAPGSGGRTVQQLSKGGDYYPALIDDITYGLERAAENGLTYDVPAIFFTQSEANINSGTPASVYLTALDQLQQDISDDVNAIVGRVDSGRVPMISYQGASHFFYSRPVPTIALAQLAQHKAGTEFYIATPAYIFEYQESEDYDSPGLHMTATGYKHLGAYYGLVEKRVVFDGAGWDCLRPIASFRQGKMIVLQFSTDSQLVLDTTLVSDPGDYGFDAVDAAGGALTITDVAVVGLNKLRVTFDDTVPANATIRTGYVGYSAGAHCGPTTGARTCLRDSLGDSIVFDPAGLNYPLHRYCVFFEESVS